MKLQNPFPKHKREVFRDFQYRCWECGTNGQASGGTELHHILGRVSSAIFNGAVLCKKCHGRMIHTFDEESKLLKQTHRIIMRVVRMGNYKLDEDDINFFEMNKKYYQ